MKESGLNYFYNTLGIDTGSFAVFYTFEANTGTNIPSVSGGQSGFSGTLSSSASFWTSPGSGHFSGTTLTVNNANAAQSETWTKIFVYEKMDVNDCVLFNSLGGGSGCKIGLTKSNKPYFESFNAEPIIAASSNNLSSKNAISVSYLTNLVTLGYYNFNSQTLETESFNYPFQVTQSDAWTLGGQFTGYMDYFIHLTQYQSPQVIGQLLSGLYAYPTGVGYSVETICSSGITGYQNVVVGETGITGYLITPGGDEGINYYTGQFPTFHTSTVLMGYLSTGLYSSGITGNVCVPVTGGQITLFKYLTGYASSFGMQKVQLFSPLVSSDIVKTSWVYTPFNDIYNKVGLRNYSGYLIADSYPTGLFNLYWNGIAQAGSGWNVTGTYLIVSGTDDNAVVTFDLKAGNHLMFNVTGGLTGYAFTYSGQEIYLNGVNLVSGYDFVVTAGVVNLTFRDTGINGYIFEYPIVLPFQTGLASLVTGGLFWRNTSNVYLNGVRQPNYASYIEGATFDLLSGNRFNYSGVQNVYNDTNLYWEN